MNKELGIMNNELGKKESRLENKDIID